MKKNWKKIALLLPLLFAVGCEWDSTLGPLPTDWFQLPELGGSQSEGSLTELASTVDGLFAAHTRALEMQGTSTSGKFNPRANQPRDMVPWRLAAYKADFAVSTTGVFGALVGDGSAAVAAKWQRIESEASKAKFRQAPALLKQDRRSAKSRPQLLIRGMASGAQVRRQLEPSIRAALASGKIKNETRFRQTVNSVAENFRSMARALSAMQTRKSGFLGSHSEYLPSAYRLEFAVGAEGQLTPIYGVGGEIVLRFDWIVTNKAIAAGRAGALTPAAKALQGFVTSVAPDINAAAQASPLGQNGFRLSKIMLALVLNASYDIGVASVNGEMVGAIVFGENDHEGGCYDPDNDGDCLTGVVPALPIAEAQDDGITLVRHATSEMLRTQRETVLGDGLLADQEAPIANFDAGGDLSSIKISHRRFRSGLTKAIGMASFFAERASHVRGEHWQMKSIETEFSLSLTGSFGLATVGGGVEVELEFENGRFGK